MGQLWGSRATRRCVGRARRAVEDGHRVQRKTTRGQASRRPFPILGRCARPQPRHKLHGAPNFAIEGAIKQESRLGLLNASLLPFYSLKRPPKASRRFSSLETSASMPEFNVDAVSSLFGYMSSE